VCFLYVYGEREISKYDEAVAAGVDAALDHLTPEDDLEAMRREIVAEAKAEATKVLAANKGDGFDSWSVMHRATVGAQKDSAGGGRIRVKGAREAYSTAKAKCVHPTTGRPVKFLGRDLEAPSEFEAAKAGALSKHLARKAGLPVAWTEHDFGRHLRRADVVRRGAGGRTVTPGGAVPIRPPDSADAR